jgi:hypothetical protein
MNVVDGPVRVENERASAGEVAVCGSWSARVSGEHPDGSLMVGMEPSRLLKIHVSSFGRLLGGVRSTYVSPGQLGTGWQSGRSGAICSPHLTEYCPEWAEIDLWQVQLTAGKEAWWATSGVSRLPGHERVKQPGNFQLHPTSVPPCPPCPPCRPLLGAVEDGQNK